MTFAIPVARFLAAELSSTAVGNGKWLENLVEVLSVRKIENKFLQCFGIFKRIVHSFIKAFDMEVFFQIFQVFHEEIKKILTIRPVSEQNSELIHFLILRLDSP